jgi:HD-like signal output (HDOD) protein
MPVHPDLRSLNIDIPSQPAALAELSILLAEEDVNLQAVSALVEQDMALAAAVLKAVNSSLYGISGRVRSVHQAITYIGMREVAAVTFEMGLKAVFPSAPELEPIWERATVRGLLMGRIGQALGVDPWAAHSAGLFEECGKPVLYRHAPASYQGLLRQAPNDEALLAMELRAFGVSHDALGAALCETWGLASAAVHSVRYHVTVNATRQLPLQVERRAICAISALANALMTDPDTLDEVAAAVAPQAQLDVTLALRGTRRVQAQIEEAVARRGG